MIEHLGKAVIGNDRYMATMEGAAASTYDPNRVPIGQGFVIRKFAKDEEFVVAIATKGQSDDEIEEARLYWWEGTLDRPSFSRPFPAGLLHLIHTDDKGRLVLIAGNRAKLYIGTGGKEFTKIQEAPKLADKKKIKLYPGAITNWQERTLIGYSNTDDANFVQGVYEFAHNNDLLPEVLNHMFTISTGDSQDTDIKIGCLRGFGQDLYISWLGADGSTYGLDKVEIDDDPAATGSYESLIVDNGNPHKEKRLDKIIIVHDGLGTGQEVIAKYKLDREASWNTGSQKGASTYNDTADSKFTELDVAKNYFELEFGFDLIATTTYPKIKAIVLIWDDLGVETSESDINL